MLIDASITNILLNYKINTKNNDIIDMLVHFQDHNIHLCKSIRYYLICVSYHNLNNHLMLNRYMLNYYYNYN